MEKPDCSECGLVRPWDCSFPLSLFFYFSFSYTSRQIAKPPDDLEAIRKVPLSLRERVGVRVSW